LAPASVTIAAQSVRISKSEEEERRQRVQQQTHAFDEKKNSTMKRNEPVDA
jgi:hypothetical protein